jgi:hypothetical protein
MVPLMTLMRIRAIVLVAILAASSVGAAFSQNVSASSPDQRVRAFVRLITTSRGTSLNEGSPSRPLAKWEHPITWTALGNTQLSMRGSVKNDMFGALMSAKVSTKGRFQADFVRPSVQAPVGTVLRDDDLPLTGRADATVSFEMETDKNGLPRLTTKYVSPTFSVSTTANITILYGERTMLRTLARQLPTGHIEPIPASDISAMRCASSVWSSEGSGIGSAIIMVTDQISWFEQHGCVQEGLMRALGVRGDVVEEIPSILSRGPGVMTTTWTRFDGSVIAMLYDPQMKSGMPPDAVERVARDLQARYFQW